MRRTTLISFLWGISLLCACVTAPQPVTPTQTSDLKEYEVVWHNDGENNQTSSVHCRYDHEAKELFTKVGGIVVKITRIELSGERAFVCDSREGKPCE
jgi:starvation-inducible outer membrane lipoprotein